MRDLAMLGLFVVLVGLAFRNVFGAYLLWGWAGLIAVQTFMYGFMRDVQYVQWFALITLLTLLLRKDTDPLITFPPLDTSQKLMLVLGFHALLAATFAYSGLARNWELCTNLLKNLLYCLLIPCLVVNRLRLHAMVIMLALSAGFHGILEGLKFVASGGGHLSQGNEKLGDRNHFAVLVAMALPLLVYLHAWSKHRIARWVVLGALVINLLAVIATQSRAGLLTLGALAIWYALMSRRKVLSLLAIVVAAGGLLAVAPDQWTDRMSTIKTADQDSSFMGRVIAWKRASAIAMNNPVFGGGFHSVQAPAIFEEYRDQQGFLGFVDTPPATYPAAAHSIYFEILGDMGFPGLFLLIALIALPFFVARKLARITRKAPELLWLRDLTFAFAAATLAYAVGGASISAAYFELLYLIVGLSAVSLRLAELHVSGRRLFSPNSAA